MSTSINHGISLRTQSVQGNNSSKTILEAIPLKVLDNSLGAGRNLHETQAIRTTQTKAILANRKNSSIEVASNEVVDALIEAITIVASKTKAMVVVGVINEVATDTTLASNRIMKTLLSSSKKT